MDLVTFTEETLNGKLHFSYSENIAQGKIISCRVKNEENIKGKFLGFIFEGGGGASWNHRKTDQNDFFSL